MHFAFLIILEEFYWKNDLKKITKNTLKRSLASKFYYLPITIFVYLLFSKK